MWIPEGLYKRLPAIYVACGVTCLITLGVSVLSALSAALFLAAAAITTVWRRDDRRFETKQRVPFVGSR
jgi:Flp pilus assembly protein TadB